MKKMMIVLCIVSGGYVSAQSTSREIETYERWENGELVEERSSAKENGESIANFDFEAWKQERQSSSDSTKNKDFEARKQEMNLRMKEMQAKSAMFFDEKKAEMKVKMAEFEKKSAEMEVKMKQRWEEQSKKMEEKKAEESRPQKSPSTPTTSLKTVRT